MSKLRTQKGVGLIEVLVALLLLGVGVLGYAALYLRAMEASNEAMIRSQAIILVRGLTESMRTNPDGQGEYPAVVSKYVNIDKKPTTPTPDCLNPTNNCTPKQIATYDAYLVADAAFELGLNMTMLDCPGVSNASRKRQCVFAAWGDTQLTATSYSNCMNNSGVYVASSKCIMMETY